MNRTVLRFCPLALALLGCDDPLKSVSLIAEPRVLGARVEVSGEPERASPRPGEAATVRFFVGAPEPEPALGWVLSACFGEEGHGVLRECASEPFAAAVEDVPVSGEPRLELVVPEQPVTSTLLVEGAICPGVAPDGASRCSGGGGTLVALDFALGTTEAANRNPSLEPETVLFDGVLWEPGVDCASLPHVSPDSSHTLGIELDESDRESLVRVHSADPDRETLQASHFATHGELERAFSVMVAEDSSLSVRVGWRAPGGVPAGGIVRFFLVVRDLRGGSDFLERAVCVE